MKTIDIIKQMIADQKFVDDLALDHLPQNSLWGAIRSDRRLVKLTRHHDRRLKKMHGPDKPGTLEFRGSKIYARFCAWVDLYPDDDLHAKIWPTVKAKLDSIMLD